MAINTPHDEKAVQKPSSSKDEDTISENSSDVPNGPHRGNSQEDLKDTGTISSRSSQENLPSALSSPFQSPSPLPSPSQPHSLFASPFPSQLDSPLSSPSAHHPRHSSSSSLQSPPPLPSLYQQNANISIEQLNELALQDSENNNVDENSNQGFDQYASIAQGYIQDQSVRPRVRANQTPGRDELDRAPLNYEARARMVRRRSSSSSSYSHRRNLSEDLACSPTASFSFNYDNDPENTEYERLPRLPNTHSDGRDEWRNPQPLPRQENSFLQSMTRYLPLPLRGGGHGPHRPLSPNNTEDDAEDLLYDFTSETLRRSSLAHPSDSLMHHGFRNPHLITAGRELRRLADAFAETEERKKVQRMAERVHLESINMENFFHLCTELFMGGITRERIVALFTFVGDIAVFHVRRQGQQFLNQLLKWSWKYLVEHICRWVKEAGGWGAVLSQGANALYQTAVLAFCVIGTAAAGLYIIKTVKDW